MPLQPRNICPCCKASGLRVAKHGLMFIVLPCCPRPQTMVTKGVPGLPARHTPDLLCSAARRRLSPVSHRSLFFTEGGGQAEKQFVLELLHLEQGSKYCPGLCPLYLDKPCLCCFLTAQRNSHATVCSGRSPWSKRVNTRCFISERGCVLTHEPSRGRAMGGRYVWVGKGYLGRRLEPTQVSGSDCKTRKGGKSQPVWGQITLDSLKKDTFGGPGPNAFAGRAEQVTGAWCCAEVSRSSVGSARGGASLPTCSAAHGRALRCWEGGSDLAEQGDSLVPFPGMAGCLLRPPGHLQPRSGLTSPLLPPGTFRTPH